MIMYICIKRVGGSNMNYVRTILIITFLYAPHIYNEDTPQAISVEETSAQSTKQEEPKIEEKTDLQRWNDHLELLTIKNEYWDSADNIPLDSWKNTAFDLAETVVKKDKSLSDTLKTSFFDAIKAKITLEKGEFTKTTTDLITEFDAMIKAQSAPPVILPEAKEVAPPAASIEPETTVPETTTEPEPVAVQPETAAVQTDAATTPATNEIPKDLKSEWNDILESLKKDEYTDTSLNKAYVLAQELLLSGYKPMDLEMQFNTALSTRQREKQLNPHVIRNVMDNFRMYLAQQVQPIPAQQLTPRNFTPQDLELEKARKIAGEKTLKAREEELEKQRRKQEAQTNIALAAAQKAQEEGALAKGQVSKLAQIIEEQKKTTRQKEEELQQQIQEARKSLAKYTEQIAASQKAEAEKGILSTLSDWWYGTSAQKQTKISPDKQEALLNILVKEVPEHLQQAAKITFKNFQNTLLNFSNLSFWDAHRERPNADWINSMNGFIKDIVITYNIMPREEVSIIVQNVFDASHQITPTNAKETLTKILSKTNKIIDAEKQKKAIEQEKAQQQKEKKEALIVAQQKIKAEEAFIESEKERKLRAATTYRDEKKEWYTLLDKVAQNKKASPQDNHTHMQKALSKSQSLLQLASDIPDKNKTAIAQKLKQKFSVALLEQQKDDNKNGEHLVNVHHHMDLFNNEINKLID
jgi:hypothetical protein